MLVFSNIYRGCTVCATVEGCCLLALSPAGWPGSRDGSLSETVTCGSEWSVRSE